MQDLAKQESVELCECGLEMCWYGKIPICPPCVKTRTDSHSEKTKRIREQMVWQPTDALLAA